MKFLSWNCNGALRKKFHLLNQLPADIKIVQECERPSPAVDDYYRWAATHLWEGKGKNKGIGIFVNDGISLERLDWADNGLEQFLPCRINDSFNLIAVWTKQANSPNFRYIGQFWKYLQIYKYEIAKEPTVICGDFNSNVRWDEWDRWWNHSDVVRELEEIKVKSLYHWRYGEIQGAEKIPTLFFQRKHDRPYHIDYAFASESIFSMSDTIEIGSPYRWLEYSDHMPLSFTMNAI